MFNQAIVGKGLSKYLSTDNDPLYRFHRWHANLRILEVEEIKTVPYVPLSHPFVERLIRTKRRDYLDHVLFWNAIDLERKLNGFKTYTMKRGCTRPWRTLLLPKLLDVAPVLLPTWDIIDGTRAVAV